MQIKYYIHHVEIKKGGECGKYTKDFYQVCSNNPHVVHFHAATRKEAESVHMALTCAAVANQKVLQSLRDLILAAEALADGEESTLETSELFGNQKKVTPANMFLSVGRSDIREAIKQARAAYKAATGEEI